MNLEEYRFPRVKNELKYVYDTINETIKLLVKYIFYTHHILMVCVCLYYSYSVGNAQYCSEYQMMKPMNMYRHAKKTYCCWTPDAGSDTMSRALI